VGKGRQRIGRGIPRGSDKEMPVVALGLSGSSHPEYRLCLSPPGQHRRSWKPGSFGNLCRKILVKYGSFSNPGPVVGLRHGASMT